MQQTTLQSRRHLLFRLASYITLHKRNLSASTQVKAPYDTIQERYVHCGLKSFVILDNFKWQYLRNESFDPLNM